jgi:hypothetical protein
MHRRLLFAFVFSLALFGVLVQAIEEETLAGAALTFVEDPKGPADVGSCPENFPIEVLVKGDHPADTNGDMIVCTDEVGKRYVDNDFLGDLEGPRFVAGHGNFFDGGKKILQDISFSFHGKNTGKGSKDFSDDAKGQFEYHDQTGQGPDLTVHGEVLCLSASGRSALLIGRVTISNDLALPVDTLVVWRAEDNGEGADGTGELLEADRVSRLAPLSAKLPKDSCRVKFPEPPPLRQIVGGNIQVQ